MNLTIQAAGRIIILVSLDYSVHHFFLFTSFTKLIKYSVGML